VTQAPEATSAFVTVAEVARQLRVSNMTVYRLINAGELRAYLAARYTQAG